MSAKNKVYISVESKNCAPQAKSMELYHNMSSAKILPHTANIQCLSPSLLLIVGWL